MDVNCGVGNRVFLILGPWRYVLAWLPALNENAIKSFKQHILQGWPADYSAVRYPQSDLALCVLCVLCSMHITEESKCELAEKTTGKYIFIMFFTFAYIIPLSVIAIFSLCILRYISRHRGPVTVAVADNTRTSAKKRQASRLLILVIVIFAVLWLPLHIHLLVFHFGYASASPFYLVLSVLWNCLAYANSCVNPLIYDHMSKDFRDAFREVMRCSSSVAAAAQRINDDQHIRRHELHASDVLAARNVDSIHDEIELNNSMAPQSPQ